MKYLYLILTLMSIQAMAQNQSNVFYKVEKKSSQDSTKKDSVIQGQNVVTKTIPVLEPVHLSGDVTCEETFEPIAATVTFMKGNEILAEAKTNPSTGVYSAEINEDGDLEVRIEAPGYKTIEVDIYVMEEDHGISEELFFNLRPTGADSVFKLQDVLFAKLQDTIAAPQKVVLDPLVKYLKEHPKVSLKIMGHSDINEAGEKTDHLAATRAWMVKRYLHYRGIANNRMVEFGYSDDRPVAYSNEPENPENRRASFKIITH